MSLCLYLASPAMDPTREVIPSLGTTGPCPLGLSGFWLVGGPQPLALNWSLPAFGQATAAQPLVDWLPINEA